LSQVTAVILAGGLGTRLRKVIPDRPKVMAEIKGKPFLYYLFDQLTEVDIDRVIISTGYMAEKIEEIVGSSHKGLQVDYCREDKPLGTGGALKLSGRAVDTEYCLVMNGDSFAEFDLISLMVVHKNSDANITVIVKSVEDSSRYGTIQMGDNNHIIEFSEKSNAASRGLINVGVYLMNTSVLQKITKKTPCSLEYDFFPLMASKGIYGYETKGEFIDIGTPESFAKAEAFFRQAPVSA
ncbi:uncharacterized protein METZ01_LOCUS462874, partial [marine metagenome]